MNITLFNNTKILVNLLFYLLFLVAFSQCKTTSKKTTSQKEDQKETVTVVPDTNEIPEIIKIKPLNESPMKKSRYSLWNSDKSMELKIERENKFGEPVSHFTYQVYKKDTQEKIKEGRVTGTVLEWNDNTSLKLTPYTGMIEKPKSDNPNDLSPAQTQVLIIKLN